MRKYYYVIAAIMAFETAGIGFSSYMNGHKAAMDNSGNESICKSNTDSLILPHTHDLGIRHVMNVHNMD